MRCIYVNLDEASARRASTELGFARCAPSGWELIRLAATPAAAAADHPGDLGPAEKACFLSHVRAVRLAAETDGPVLIVEDDVLFTRRMFGVLDHFVRAGDWQMVLPEAAIGGGGMLLRMLHRYPGLVRAGQFELMDLSTVPFYSATAYALSDLGKRWLLAILDGLERLDNPYDMVLRNLTNTGQLKSALIFPFVSSITDHADASQIGEPRSGIYVADAFRRLMFVERDEAACRARVDRIRDEICDEDSMMAGVIVAGFLSARF